jgi:CHAT domain-containing protein/tetratricopeptide (TPR) repeat protein
MFCKHLMFAILLSSVAALPTVFAQDNDPTPPYKRVLSPDQAKQVADLEKEIARLSAAGNFAQACKPAQQALQIRTAAQGKDHWEVINARMDLDVARTLSKQPAADQKAYAGIGKLQEDADALMDKGLYAQAQPLFETMLAIRCKELGEEHSHTAKSYHDVADNLYFQGKSKKAQALNEKALAIRRKVLGEEHPATANSYGNLGLSLNAQGKYAEAQPLFEKALAIDRKVLGEQRHETAASSNNVAFNLDAQGKYTEARPLFEKALAVHRKELGEDHPDTAMSYNNLAMNLHAQGKYAEAQPLFETALAIRRKVMGQEHPQTAVCYASVALNLYAQGKNAEAQPLYERALAINRKVLGEEHAQTASSYNSVAFNLYAQRKYAEAQPLFEKALAIRRKALGEAHPVTAASYNNVGFNLNAQGKYTEARPLFEKALALRRKVLGEEHPYTAISYNNVAANLSHQGKYAEAQPFYQRALAIRSRELGEEHPDTATSYSNLAFDLKAQGKTSEAIAHWQVASRVSESARLQVAGTGFDRALYQRDLISPHEALAIALAELHEPDQAWHHAEAYFARGLLDDLDPAVRQNPEVPGRLAKLTGQLVPLLGRSNLSPQERDRRDALRAETDALRKSLSQADAERAAKRVWPLEKIQSAIPADAAVVFWLDVRKDHWACILRRSGLPTWQRLPGTGPDERWTDDDDSLPQRTYAAALVAPENPERDKLLAALRVQRFEPLLPHLLGIHRLLIVPARRMAKVPIESLTDRFTISYIPSASIFAQLHQQHRPLEGRTLLALGDPAFTPASEKTLASPDHGPYSLVAQRSEPIADLPGTKVEVNTLAGLVPDTKLLLGSAASEQTLEQLAQLGQLKHYRLLHLATHGQVNEGMPTESALILAQDRISRELHDQIARTLGGKKPLDGRLTVGTILDTWQLDADQVVLSACETGLGTDARGEGLLGFAQALLQKGARSVVLSRWKVPDRATALLMKRYYQNILGKRAELRAPLPRAEGLREAKHWLRTLSQADMEKQVADLPGSGELRSVKKAVPVTGGKLEPSDRPFAAPYYWAAFVLIGDPD